MGVWENLEVFQMLGDIGDDTTDVIVSLLVRARYLRMAS